MYIRRYVYASLRICTVCTYMICVYIRTYVHMNALVCCIYTCTFQEAFQPTPRRYIRTSVVLVQGFNFGSSNC